MAVNLSAISTGSALLSRNIIFLILVVRLEELGKFKNFIHLIGCRTRDLPACSTVPQALGYRVP
jgi:hypothetical protein